MSTRFFPMSCTSPFTVASTIVPFCCAPAFFSIFGSRYATACFITPAESSTDGNCILRAPNNSPTVRIPSSNTVLMMSSGEYCPSAESSNCSRDCLCSPSPTDFSPLMIANFSLSSIDSVSTCAVVDACGFPFSPAKCPMYTCSGSPADVSR